MTGTQTNWLRDGAAEDELRYDDDDGPADDDQEVASAAKGVTAAATPHRSRQSSRGDKVEALKHQRFRSHYRAPSLNPNLASSARPPLQMREQTSRACSKPCAAMTPARKRREGVACVVLLLLVFLFFVLSLFLTLSRQQWRFLKLNETADRPFFIYNPLNTRCHHFLSVT